MDYYNLIHSQLLAMADRLDEDGDLTKISIWILAGTKDSDFF